MANLIGFKVEIEIPKGALAELKKAAEEAFEEVATELDGRFQDAISDKAWPWPRPSKRGLGGGSLSEKARAWREASFNTNAPRSIVDSGELKQSRMFNVKGLQAEWAWTAEYAAAVHDGAMIHPWGNTKAAKVELPPRPWTTAVLKGGTAASIDVYDIATELSKRIPLYLD